MDNLNIRMFGPLEMAVGCTRLPPFATKKSRLLFSYLLLFRDRSHARDVLAGTFWGEYSDAVARKHLRDALWRIRQVLTAAGRRGLELEVEGHAIGVGVGHESWLDIREFEQTLQRLGTHDVDCMKEDDAQVMQVAVDLYRADLLQEVYDDWCVYERERLRILALEGLQQLLSYHMRREEWSPALLRGQRLLQADPLNEPVHRDIMRCYAGMGNRGAAVRQFSICAQLLKQELDVDPSNATLVLYDEICCVKSRDGDVVTLSPHNNQPVVGEALRYLKLADRGLRRTRRDLREGMKRMSE